MILSEFIKQLILLLIYLFIIIAAIKLGAMIRKNKNSKKKSVE